MDIANEKKPVDYLTFFTKQLPRDLAALATLRDELEKRQGAMTAVEDALKIKSDAVALRQKAKDELEAARNEAATLAQESKVKIDLANAREKAADQREQEFDRKASVTNTEMTAKDRAFKLREDRKSVV
jgi:Skp family chaperone for outer membrane proteins